MVSKTHDPRQDPKTGDTIAKASADRFINRIVSGRVGDMIQYRSKEGGMTKVCNLKAWRVWALDAAVIVTAD